MKLDFYPNFKKYLNRSLLAVDYGTHVIGLSTFIPGKDPFPLLHGKIIVNGNPQNTLKELKLILETESIEIIIIGIPYLTDGTATKMTQNVLKFKDELEKTFHQCSVIEQDETLSSFEAKDRMENSPRFNFKFDPKFVDMVAASIILEDFIKN